jgi:hypothetical protein
MANGRGAGFRGDAGRDPGGFVALPWSVLDCPAYALLSHPAKALLLEVARQFVRDNNGRLLLSKKHLTRRGWTSADVITRAKRELLSAGFIFETVMGHRPNKASWYAVTWRKLDRNPKYDEGTLVNFRQGAYMSQGLQTKPTRDQLYEKWRDGVVSNSLPGSTSPKELLKNATLRPSKGVDESLTAPAGGVGTLVVVPSGGAMESAFAPTSTPSHGNHLEVPSHPRQVH